jgi:hypothetical protein
LGWRGGIEFKAKRNEDGHAEGETATGNTYPALVSVRMNRGIVADCYLLILE